MPVFVDDVNVNIPFEAAFPTKDDVTANNQAAADGTVTVQRVAANAPVFDEGAPFSSMAGFDSQEPETAWGRSRSSAG